MHIITQTEDLPYPILVDGPRGQGLALTIDEAKDLTGLMFAELYLSHIDDTEMTLGERMSVVLDALADMLGRADDDETDNDAGYISGSMGSDDA